MMLAPTTLAIAMIEVTDKSMPATISTKVWPIATTSNGSMSDRMFRITSTEAMCGTNGSTARK